jgi:hypothetical protein
LHAVQQSQQKEQLAGEFTLFQSGYAVASRAKIFSHAGL